MYAFAVTFFLRLLTSILFCSSLAASLFGAVAIIPALYFIWFTDCLKFASDDLRN